jgi:ferric-dicitrate binding protein FerR (iron transport regulator)
MNESYSIKQLLDKSDWTPAECRWLLNYLENSGETELKNLMQQYFSDDLENGKAIDPVVSERLLGAIQQHIAIPPRKHQKSKVVSMWTIRIAAASLIGVIALSTLVWVKQHSKQPIAQINQISKSNNNDVNPGGNKAVLTLADGSTIILDDAKNGAIAQQGNTKVVKIDGKLNYTVSEMSTQQTVFNTISTPRGGQYQVELPDGSKVWLNSVSSLRFPTFFNGKQRRVEITGEAYFEVAKNQAMPFIVIVNGAEIEVLGTHFNVNAYSDESTIRTTLLEGSVKFAKDGNFAILKPGQQSQLSLNGQLKTINDVEIEKVVAWKNGFFHFEASDFKTLSKQLARWYDVEVVYDKEIDDLFYAKVPRSTKLSDLLKALSLTGKINFKIEGKKIIVLP